MIQLIRNGLGEVTEVRAISTEPGSEYNILIPFTSYNPPTPDWSTLVAPDLDTAQTDWNTYINGKTQQELISLFAVTTGVKIFRDATGTPVEVSIYNTDPSNTFDIPLTGFDFVTYTPDWNAITAGEAAAAQPIWDAWVVGKTLSYEFRVMDPQFGTISIIKDSNEVPIEVRAISTETNKDFNILIPFNFTTLVPDLNALPLTIADVAEAVWNNWYAQYTSEQYTALFAIPILGSIVLTRNTFGDVTEVKANGSVGGVAFDILIDFNFETLEPNFGAGSTMSAGDIVKAQSVWNEWIVGKVVADEFAAVPVIPTEAATIQITRDTTGLPSTVTAVDGSLSVILDFDFDTLEPNFTTTTLLSAGQIAFAQPIWEAWIVGKDLAVEFADATPGELVLVRNPFGEVTTVKAISTVTGSEFDITIDFNLDTLEPNFGEGSTMTPEEIAIAQPLWEEWIVGKTLANEFALIPTVPTEAATIQITRDLTGLPNTVLAVDGAISVVLDFDLETLEPNFTETSTLSAGQIAFAQPIWDAWIVGKTLADEFADATPGALLLIRNTFGEVTEVRAVNLIAGNEFDILIDFNLDTLEPNFSEGSTMTPEDIAIAQPLWEEWIVDKTLADEFALIPTVPTEGANIQITRDSSGVPILVIAIDDNVSVVLDFDFDTLEPNFTETSTLSAGQIAFAQPVWEAWIVGKDLAEEFATIPPITGTISISRNAYGDVVAVTAVSTNIANEFNILLDFDFETLTPNFGEDSTMSPEDIAIAQIVWNIWIVGKDLEEEFALIPVTPTNDATIQITRNTLGVPISVQAVDGTKVVNIVFNFNTLQPNFTDTSVNTVGQNTFAQSVWNTWIVGKRLIDEFATIEPVVNEPTTNTVTIENIENVGTLNINIEDLQSVIDSITGTNWRRWQYRLLQNDNWQFLERSANDFVLYKIQVLFNLIAAAGSNTEAIAAINVVWDNIMENSLGVTQAMRDEWRVLATELSLPTSFTNAI